MEKKTKKPEYRPSTKIGDKTLKHLLVLQGAANHGKTSTLNILIELIRKKYSNTPFAVFPAVRGPDCIAIIVISGVTIVISTFGDNESTINRTFDVFDHSSVVIGITAIHPEKSDAFTYFSKVLEAKSKVEKWKFKVEYFEKKGLSRKATKIEMQNDNEKVARSIFVRLVELVAQLSSKKSSK